MTCSEASFARDALAKHIYSLLFSNMVNMINKSLRSSSKSHRFIGVLVSLSVELFRDGLPVHWNQ